MTLNAKNELENNTKLSIVYKMNGLSYSWMVKSISFFSNGKYQHPVHINKSCIKQAIGSENFFCELNMANMLNCNTLDMNLLCSKSEIKRLGYMSHSEGVVILLDENNNNYIITDGNNTIEVERSHYTSLPLPPELDFNGTSVQPLSFPGKKLRRYVSKSEPCVLALYDGQLEEIIFSKGNKFTLLDNNFITLRDRKPDLLLRSNNFLKVIGDRNHKLSLIKDCGGYWLLTESIMSQGVICKTYELLE